MAATRETVDVKFIFNSEPYRSTLDLSSPAWALITRGFKQAAISFYHDLLQPIFAEENPDETLDKVSLAVHNLTKRKYRCKLRIGEAEKDENEEVAERIRKKKGGLWYKEDVDRPKRVHGLIVEIMLPRQYEDPSVGQVLLAKAATVFDRNGVDYMKLERVHVKWSTDVNRLKDLYHEADIYDKLRRANVNLTPKFYGFYGNYDEDLAFGIAVYERGEELIQRVNSRKPTLDILAKFVRAAQRLHEQGICHNQLLEGNKVVGFRMSDNVRVRVDEILGTEEVVFVNFEKATKHRGFSCPSIKSDFTQAPEAKGCKELDNIYDFYTPAHLRFLKEREIGQNDYMDWDTGSAASISL